MLTYNERRMLVVAQASPKREVCGALLRDDKGLEHFMQIENISPYDGQFRMADKDVIQLHEIALSGNFKIRAIWHSHPGGSMLPSDMDKKVHPRSARYMVIVCPTDREVHYYGRPGDEWSPARSAAPI